PIQRFLHALSIHHVGKKVAKLLAEEIDHVLELASWTKEHFEGIKDIGPVVAQNVLNYFGDEANVAMIKEMEELGVNITATAKDKRAVVADTGHHLSGKTILFTGTLHQMGRKEAQEKAESLGAKNLGAVSSNLNILVVGDNAGSKLKKAKELGTVEVLTEQEFLDLL
ncbi:MAG: helix-hairpin-helix domain-containing protein, partial [Saprospiraceae bacterium]